MIQIKEKEQCCGCTACYNICPKNAIVMKTDDEGFEYPVIDMDNCVDCGACERVCPIQNMQEPEDGERLTVALRTLDDNDLLGSTSGGFITPLIKYVLEKKGVICAASYSDEFKVEHVFVEGGTAPLDSIRGSKYVQSSLGNCYQTIKRYLELEIIVLFVGTTCQVNGLKTFLNKDYEKLITVDLVCHGTPSPKLWSKYLNYQRERYHSEIKSISFRNKTYGYHSGTMKICFENGKTYYGSARVDYMLKSFFKEIASRPICYKCPFKTLERCSDFTIYDCWSASELIPGLKDDDKGYTNVIIQSKKGKQVFERIKNRYIFYPVDTQKAISMDGIMVLNSAVPHPKRFEFYKGLDARSLPDHIQIFIPVGLKDKLIEKSKRVIYKTGLYLFLKKILK